MKQRVTLMLALLDEQGQQSVWSRVEPPSQETEANRVTTLSDTESLTLELTIGKKKRTVTVSEVQYE